MFLTTSIAGRAKARETLYDGEVCLLEKQGRVLRITSCLVYELHFKTRHVSDSIVLEAGFIVELAFEHLDPAGASLKEIKKLSCHQRLFPDIPLPDRPPGNEQLFVIPMINSIAYRYGITEDGMGIRLILSAVIDYIATGAYYSNILECRKEQPEPGHKTECISWQSVFDNIRLDDALACLENLTRLLKIRTLFREQEKTHPVPGEALDYEMKEESCRLRELHQAQEERIQSGRMTIAHLQSELREREEIISKLLVLLDRANQE